MAAPIGCRLTTRPLDNWSTRERLALASSVKKSGDQNWVSVSRAIKPFVEKSRPPDWFSQKNCALQYADLLEQAETPKRKRGEKGEREVVDTPANQIVRKLTIERIEDLKQLVQEEQERYKQLKIEVEEIKGGKCDEEITEMWENIQAEKRAAEELRLEEEERIAMEIAERAKAQAARKLSGFHRLSSTVSSVSEMDESTQDSMPDTLNVETTDDELPATPTIIQPITIQIPQSHPQDMKPEPPTSPLLSSLLQSKQFSVDSLQQIKAEAEANHALKAANQAEALQQLTNQQTELPTNEPFHNISEELSTDEIAMAIDVKVENEVTVMTEVKTEVDIETTEQVIEVECGDIKEEIVECSDMIVEETIEVTTHESPVKTHQSPVKTYQSPVKTYQSPVKTHQSPVKAHQSPVKTLQPKSDIPGVEDVVEVSDLLPPSSYIEDDVSVKDEPLSPASSISSRISETGSKSSSRKSKAGGRGSTGTRRGSVRTTRRSNTDDLSSRPSDAETTDDDGDSSIVLAASGTVALSESIPNSPHSSHCSDTEDDKAYKSWKKSIMLVWRAAANHKYANVFLHPVTDDIAPGYSTVVKRPKDLMIVKRHIENGTIRTTSEFQRDMMLMFTNAIMYNNANHDVYRMAIEMYNDVLEQIEVLFQQYVNTQIMVQNTEAKLLRPTRRNESSDKEEESRRRRTSSEAEGGKTKKRKSRADET